MKALIYCLIAMMSCCIANSEQIAESSFEETCKKIQEIYEKQKEISDGRKSTYYESNTESLKITDYSMKTPTGIKLKRHEIKNKDGKTISLRIVNSKGVYQIKNNKAYNIKKIEDMRAQSNADLRTVILADPKKYASKALECKIEEGEFDGKKCFVVTDKHVTPKALYQLGEKEQKRLYGGSKGAAQDFTTHSVAYIGKDDYFTYKTEDYFGRNQKDVLVYSNVKFNEEFDPKLFEIPAKINIIEITTIEEYKKYFGGN